MRPTIALDVAVLRANARAWREQAGVPLRAVVKANGYGWGFGTVVRALEPVVDGFVVADLDEFVRVRSLTTRPVAVLADVVPSELGRVLDAGGLPNVSSAEALAAAVAWSRRSGRRARVRVGIRNSAGWAGLTPEGASSLASALAAAPLDIELWTHLTDPAAYEEQRATFEGASGTLRAAGARVVGTDIESSQPLAGQRAAGQSVRVGVGTFGFRFGTGPPLRSAISVTAPLVERLPACGQRIGYGSVRAPSDGWLAVLRCGYSDGFPRGSWPDLGILSVGMQYTIVTSLGGWDAGSVKLVGAETDLDHLAAGAGIGEHELVLRLAHGRTDHSNSLAG